MINHQSYVHNPSYISPLVNKVFVCLPEVVVKLKPEKSSA